MYIIEIKTKYNVINVNTNDYTQKEIMEMLDQPYVESVRLKRISDNKEIVKEKVKKREVINE